VGHVHGKYASVGLAAAKHLHALQLIFAPGREDQSGSRLMERNSHRLANARRRSRDPDASALKVHRLLRSCQIGSRGEKELHKFSEPGNLDSLIIAMNALEIFQAQHSPDVISLYALSTELG